MQKLLPLLLVTALMSGCGGSSDTGSVTKNTDGKNPVVVLKTSLGSITVELYADKAPKTVENFVGLTEKGYYTDLTFHRVIPDFMIQGGDPTGTGAGGESLWGGSFEDEKNDVKMVRGVLAMANSGPNTNGSQFFIIQGAETPWLQGKHTAFGKVIAGLDTVDAIAKTPRDGRDKPKTPVTFTAELQ